MTIEEFMEALITQFTTLNERLEAIEDNIQKVVDQLQDGVTITKQ